MIHLLDLSQQLHHMPQSVRHSLLIRSIGSYRACTANQPAQELLRLHHLSMLSFHLKLSFTCKPQFQTAKIFLEIIKHTAAQGEENVQGDDKDALNRIRYT